MGCANGILSCVLDNTAHRIVFSHFLNHSPSLSPTTHVSAGVAAELELPAASSKVGG